LFIHNKFVDAKSGKTFDTINPATEEVITSMQWAGQEDIDDAVKSSAEAFEVYRKLPGCERRTMMLKLADLVEKHRQQLAEVECMDNGKPVHVADAVDIGFVIECYRYYAGWTDKAAYGGKLLATTRDTHGTLSYTRHEPVGVCGAIIPWNFPLLMQCWKLGPALAMGCTIVMKLSEKTPLTGLMMCHLIAEAGFPAGTVNIVNGMGACTGNMIASHMDIKKIAFTGSGPVGRKIIMASAQSNMKKVSLELGGKSAMIVCKDANLDEAAIACHVGLFINMGQACCASSRILIHEDVHDEFVKKCVDLASTLRQGTDAGGDKATAVPVCDMGPQVDKIQFDKIMSYIESGKKEGAKCVLGGKRRGTKGYFIEPTIFTEVQDDMKICREEIFGPVMQLMKFKTNEEAVRRANASEFGLAAGVCSRDIGNAIAIAHELQGGSVWVNTYDNFDMACPFGGYKESGWGSDKGEYALANYTITKCVTTPIAMN
jgi:aldehyde dehydrogenase (NAD+)